MPLIRFILLSIAAFLWSGAAMAQTSLPACGSFPAGAESYACTCKAGFTVSTVWGSGIYSTDSNICAAAQHAGAIPSEGGKVLVVAAPGQENYLGSTQNGITTQKWGKLDSSFMFVNPNLLASAAANGAGSLESCTALANGQDRVTCACTAGGGTTGVVWGSGPYTADSNICAAARHAGAIGATGGTVTALRAPGLPTYRGSAANGVSSSDWGSFNSSLIFDRN